MILIQVDNKNKKLSLDDVEKIINALEATCRNVLSVVGCAEAARICGKTMAYYSQVANDKRVISAKKSLEILKKIEKSEEVA